jgi:hypothetical protein
MILVRHFFFWQDVLKLAVEERLTGINLVGERSRTGIQRGELYGVVDVKVELTERVMGRLME